MTGFGEGKADREAEIGRLAGAALQAVQHKLSGSQAERLERLLSDPANRTDYQAMQKLVRSLHLFASDAVMHRLAQDHPSLASVFHAARQFVPAEDLVGRNQP